MLFVYFVSRPCIYKPYVSVFPMYVYYVYVCMYSVSMSYICITCGMYYVLFILCMFTMYVCILRMYKIHIHNIHIKYTCIVYIHSFTCQVFIDQSDRVIFTC